MTVVRRSPMSQPQAPGRAWGNGQTNKPQRTPTVLTRDAQGFMMLRCGFSQRKIPKAIGLPFDRTVGLWAVLGIWHARALWHYATPVIDAELRAIFPGEERPEKAPRLPVMFLDRDGRRMVFVAPRKEEWARELQVAGWSFDQNEQIWHTRQVRSVLAFRDYIDTGLRRRLAPVLRRLEQEEERQAKRSRKSRLPFRDLSQVSISELMEILDATLARSGGGGLEENEDLEEIVFQPVLDLKTVTHPQRGQVKVYWSNIPLAEQYGFRRHERSNGWVTANRNQAEQLRDVATLKAETDFQREHLRDIRVSVPEDFAVPAPEDYTLSPYQVDGVLFALRRRNALIGDEMGVGKTPQGLAWLNALQVLGAFDQPYMSQPSHPGANGSDAMAPEEAPRPRRRALIVVPAFLRTNWRREARRWLVGLTVAPYRSGRPLPDADVIICSYEMLHHDALQGVPWVALLADEAHYLKNPDARRTKAFMRMHGERALFMTGTPIYNRPQDLWALLHRIAPTSFPDMERFMAFYKVERLDEVKIGDAKNRLARNLAALQSVIRDPENGIMIRRLKADVMADLPAKVRQMIVVDLPDRQAYDLQRRNAQVEEDLQRLAEGGAEGNNRVFRNQVLAELTRLRRDLGHAKLTAVRSLISDLAEAGEPFVVFTYYRDLAEEVLQIVQGAGVRCGIAHGGMSTDARQAEVDRLQEAEIDALVCTMTGAGTGLTMTRASTVVFLELDWSPTTVLQSEDRLHRRGQMNEVSVIYLVVDKTIDSRIGRTLVEKDDLATHTLGDDNANDNGLLRTLDDLDVDAGGDAPALVA